MQLNRPGRDTSILAAIVLGSLAFASQGRSKDIDSTSRRAAAVPITWQHHQVRFSYVGFTTLYVCDSLESQVNRILKYLGARADLHVRASCSQLVTPTGHAVVDADFYSPVPADDASPGAGSGRWTAVELQSGHPDFIGAGDCELIQAMKAVVTANFTWRNLDYNTSCFPNDLTLHDFGVTGEALRSN